MKHLTIGSWMTPEGGPDGGPVLIPLDGVTKAYAINGIRESGKSSLGTVLAEEYCKAKQPWVAFDPGGNWWGLRALPNGKPGGFPVVVFGGERADLPLEKGSGRKIAEAVANANVFAVVDLKLTSKTVWRTLVRDIFATLQEITVEVPRHIFLEEAQEFIPQKASYQLGQECSEIVERMVTLGGNWGYGVTIMGQRPASISKSALSQCETVFAFATQGKHDRVALTDWMESNQVGDAERAALANLADLPTGQCYVWSPRFMKVFGRLAVRRRTTLHPREARKNGLAMRDIDLAPVDDFVAKLRKELTKTVATVCPPIVNSKTAKAVADMVYKAKGSAEVRSIQAGPDVHVARQLNDQSLKIADLEKRVDELQKRNQELQTVARDAERRLAAVRDHLKPQYDAMRELFSDLGNESVRSGSHQASHYAPFLQKAGRAGCKKMLEILIERGHATKAQLGTLAGVPSTKRTFRNYMSWLKGNNLVEVSGDEVKLRSVV